MTMRMTESQLNRVQRLREKLVGGCNRCGGTGYTLDGSVLTYCGCSYVFEYLMELIIAEIPRTYWELALDNLESVDEVYRKFARKFTKHLARAVENSLGIMFLGPNGVGKTSLQVHIGKEAVAQGYRVRYTTLEQYLEAIRSKDSELPDALDRADIVLLDEIDKAYVKQGSDFSLKKTEDFIRSSISQGKSLIVCSNLSQEGLSETFGESLFSMVRRKLKIVEIDGTDYSDTLQDSWGDLLEDTFNYYSPEILRLTSLFHSRGEDE